ncbi:carbon monoxide dehydrogenase subunit G [Streptomyces sp. OF3]|uniref:Carbon monoxide dehydrogenase subunit G n=1 Tax=Streptomyces alkaliterrae TaxID=2213162 RepID=A0A7W3ZPJ5_9ACTN|nr:carbon monoxide dehydrogenase subunit G [Streptomyces alkaliterrae]MBB1255746.1 carbon monoxide dehydrogenase subunit G [Streptomyces alkaliterrae]
MEHEVYVPFPVGSVRAALAEPERGMRCVPGLKLDAVNADEADDAVVRGRLRVRVAGSTITYRGMLRLSAEQNGFSILAEGTEARGSGAARMRLTVTPRPSYGPGTAGAAGDGPPGGTVLAFAGGAEGTGRLAEFGTDQLTAAARRLLDRFGAALGESLAADPSDDDNARVIPGIPAPETSRDAGGEQAAAAAEQPKADDASDTDAAREEPHKPSIFDTEIPPPSLDPLADDVDDADALDGDTASRPDADALDDAAALDAAESPDMPVDDLFADTDADDDTDADADADADADDDTDTGGLTAFPEPAGPPPAEAAHARRTMIGRSAEEVDHAPPRGRYAPVPPPEPSTTGATLRWAAPAAALAVASAVLLTRALRRRR